jgi:hypothetical protein
MFLSGGALSLSFESIRVGQLGSISFDTRLLLAPKLHLFTAGCLDPVPYA